MDIGTIDMETMVNPSSLGTGGGTDHDGSVIFRPTYRWESLLSDPIVKPWHPRRRILGKLGAWLGLTPLWQSQRPSLGLSLDLSQQGGHYVLTKSDCARSH
jgi:hypothetical protein